MDHLDPGDHDRGSGERAEQGGAPHVPPRQELLKIGREPLDRTGFQNPARLVRRFPYVD